MPDFNIRHPDWERMWPRWQQARCFLLGGAHVLDPGYAVSPAPISSGVELEPSTSEPVEGARPRSIYDVRVRGAAQSFLWKHDRETDEEYADRARRLYHLAIFRSVINVYVAGILKMPPRRDAKGEAWERYDNDVDGRGTKVDTFCRRALTMALAYGRVHAITDRPPSPFEVATKADAAAAPQPYSYLVSPLDIVDWALDDRGEFVWLVHREDAPDTRSPGSAPPKTRNQYRIWTRSETAVWRETESGVSLGSAFVASPDSFEQIGGTIAHGLGRIPVATLWATEEDRQKEMACESAFADTLDLDRHALNKLSELDETERSQTFALLAVPVREGGAKAEISVGPFRAFAFDADVGTPSYVSPDGSLPDGKWSRVESQIQMSRTLEGASRGRAEYSKEERSASSIAVESEDKRSRMTWWSASVEEFDEQLHRNVGLWSGEEYDPPAAYTKDFDFRAISAQVQDIVSLNGVGLPQIVKAALVSQPVLKILREGGAGAEQIREVVESLAKYAKEAPPKAAPSPVVPEFPRSVPRPGNGARPDMEHSEVPA